MIHPFQGELTSHSMHLNASTSPLLSLPPELRLRIYDFAIGGRHIWIGQIPSSSIPPYLPTDREHNDPKEAEAKHFGERLSHVSRSDRPTGGLHLGLLRLCRQVYTETALLPYSLNKFFFDDNAARKAFEQAARPGRKRAQKRAVGEYEIVDWDEFCRSESRRECDSLGYDSLGNKWW